MEGKGLSNDDLVAANPAEYGIIPRSVEKLFTSVSELKKKNWNFEMEANYVEIYNDSIRDLLAKKHLDTKCEIKLDQKSNPYVTNHTVIKVHSPTQVYELLQRASKNRVVAQTKMNQHSSRSHSVFQLKLKGFNSATDVRTECNPLFKLTLS